MGWGYCGTDSKGRKIGYSIPATCDHPGCEKLIDRGLSFACGGMHGDCGGQACEGYFCSDHLRYVDKEAMACDELAQGQLCFSCFEEAKKVITENVMSGEYKLVWNNPPKEEPATALPEDIANHLLLIGKVEWGSTHVLSDEEHTKAFAKTLALTREHYNVEGPQPLHGVYLTDAATVVCHTGTSPRSGETARVISGIWNYFVELATLQKTNQNQG